MGGTPGPAPRSMQLSRPSLLSYLQRFNEKRRLHYKIDLLPRLTRERDRKSTRLNSSHTEIYTLSLHDALPISMQLSRPSLLSYLQRFNEKRRLHYKIDLLPRLTRE